MKYKVLVWATIVSMLCMNVSYIPDFNIKTVNKIAYLSAKSHDAAPIMADSKANGPVSDNYRNFHKLISPDIEIQGKLAFTAPLCVQEKRGSAVFLYFYFKQLLHRILYPFHSFW
ncbi:MAG: hypothetical protein KDC04_07070 [Saprospiraceae bacterium]|nr:hypothetical protein [Saprospiraceae bacterium]